MAIVTKPPVSKGLKVSISIFVGTLPVRLCVFALPAIFIVLSCVFRWRHLKHDKEQVRNTNLIVQVSS